MRPTSIGSLLLVALLGGGVGGALGSLLARPASPDPAPGAAGVPQASLPPTSGELARPVATDSDLAELGQRLAELEQSVAGWRQILLARGDGGTAAAQAMTAKSPLAPVTETEIQRFLEIERAVARLRSVRERQERALSSVARILDEAKVAADARAQVDPLVRGYLGDEQQILMVDRNSLQEAGRELLEAQHLRLKDGLMLALRRRLEPPVAEAVVAQLWHGGPAGRSFGRSRDGARALGPGDIEIPPGIGPFRK